MLLYDTSQMTPDPWYSRFIPLPNNFSEFQVVAQRDLVRLEL